MLRQTLLAPLRDGLMRIRCPVLGCKKCCSWTKGIYSLADALNGADLAWVRILTVGSHRSSWLQCSEHMLVAFRTRGKVGKRVQTMPFTLDNTTRWEEFFSPVDNTHKWMMGCARCGGRQRNTVCGMLLCTHCCRQVTVPDSRKIRCGVDEHDNAKGKNLAEILTLMFFMHEIAHKDEQQEAGLGWWRVERV